jgi:putative RecB family exonuclease
VQQLGFEGMPKRLYACTPTRLGTWLDCPRRYRMTYLDRPPPAKGPPWAHNSLGASVHNALAGWWRLPRHRRTVAAAGDLLDQGWIGEGFADSLQSARYRHWARGLVEGYVTGLDPASEPIGVERTVATRTELIAVSGRIDRLDDRRGPDGRGELVVVDYKTGRHMLTVDDARTSLPLALYALAAERVMRRPCRRVELHHLPTGRVLAWEHTAESLARQLRRAEDIAAECAAADERFRAEKDALETDGAVKDGAATAGTVTDGTPADVRQRLELPDVFPPRPGFGCGWCDYRASCPEGSAASEPRRPWDALHAEGAGSPPAGSPPAGSPPAGSPPAGAQADGSPPAGAQAEASPADRGAPAHAAVPD